MSSSTSIIYRSHTINSVLASSIGTGNLLILVACGMLRGKGWSWNMFLILNVVNIIEAPILDSSCGVVGTETVSQEAIDFFIYLALLYYITRHVMEYFGKKSIR